MQQQGPAAVAHPGWRLLRKGKRQKGKGKNELSRFLPFAFLLLPSELRRRAFRAKGKRKKAKGKITLAASLPRR
jgi:hypothetical protein